MTENKLAITSEEKVGEVNVRVGDEQIQTNTCKISYKAILYNMGI